jgi:hypothetical protein
MTRGTLSGLTAGLLLGVVMFGIVRLLALPSPDEVHYHANWAVWIEGQRVDFSDDRYMEDVAACQADPTSMTAESRVHMHDNNPEVIHVHHGGATWAHLLQNLGWGIGDGWIMTDTGDLFREGDGNRLSFILNGMEVPPAHDRVIRPGDRMLVSFGNEAAEELLRERFPMVKEDAQYYDDTYDPGGCGAGHADHDSLADRLRRAFWF